MRIGIDVSCWVSGRGYGRYTREIVRAMAEQAREDDFACLLARQDLDRFDLHAPNVRAVPVGQSVSPTQAASATGSRSLRDMLGFTRAVWREAPDVFLFPTVYTYFPLPPGQTAVVVIHDAIAERFPELTLPSRRARLFWNVKVRLALRQARLILTVSEYSAEEIAEVLAIDPERIRVTGEAPAACYEPSDAEAIDLAARRAGLPEGARWFTYVGGFNPHKRLDVVVRAHARVVQELAGDPPHLLLVGTTDGDVFHGNLEAIRRAVAEEGTDDLVHWPGFVHDEELRHLHSGAVALLLVSESEGFGLPAVEAAACGTPVIATSASPLPVLLDGAGIFTRPGDVSGVAQAMRAFLLDEPRRRAMGARGRERALALSWKRSAAAALAALEEAA